MLVIVLQDYPLSSGREVILLRDIERVFPVYGKSVKAELDLALKQKAQVLEATQGGKFQSDVDKFYRDLDAINSDVRAALISGYSTLALKISVAAEPSQVADAFTQWDRILELVVREAFHVRAINQQLASVKTMTSGAEWQKLFTLRDQALQTATELKQISGK